MKKINNEELIKNFDTLYVYDNNHTDKYRLGKHIPKNNKKRILRIITLHTLKNELNFFKKYTFEYFLTKEIPKDADKNTTLALIVKNRLDEEKIIFYVFNNSKKEIENDIPFFHKNAPDGYSFFCTRNEYSQLIQFLRRSKKNKKIKPPQQEKIILEPEPNKKHFVCQICKIKFENYLEHIRSKFHEQNKMNFCDTFIRIKNTFKRIVDFHKEKKENREKEENKESNVNKELLNKTYRKKSRIRTEHRSISKLNGNENKVPNMIIENNINNNNINDETKCDSSFKENKNSINDNKLRKTNKIRIKYPNISNKENEEISLINIESILNDMKYEPVKKKKRKKSEARKSFFNDNYIYDFQKVTGKIAYFNNYLTCLKNH